jgi:hypothetical protein
MFNKDMAMHMAFKKFDNVLPKLLNIEKNLNEMPNNFFVKSQPTVVQIYTPSVIIATVGARELIFFAFAFVK